MSLAYLISTYGYFAVGIGTFLEGEAILVLAGFAAHRGYLELPWVIVCAFLGTVTSDQLFFYLGRVKGKKILDKRPSWQANSEKIFALLHRHKNWFILGFRFLYGLRTVTPVVIGASSIQPLRYFILNVAGALLWAIAFGTGGYLFGQTLETLIGNIEKYEKIVFMSLAAIGVLVWFYHFFLKRPGKRTK